MYFRRLRAANKVTLSEGGRCLSRRSVAEVEARAQTVTAAITRPHPPKLRTVRDSAHHNCRRWELHRIAPFDYVFHPLALIDFVNQFGGVVHKTHRDFARHAG